MFNVKTYNLFNQIGIFEHYLRLRKGLISIKDLIYFIALNYILLILSLSLRIIKNKKSRVGEKEIKLIKKLLFPVLLVTAAQWIDIRLDFTQDQRYTLNSSTKEILETLDRPIKIDVFLGGKLPADYLRLSREIKGFIQSMEAHSDKILLSI